MTERRRSNGRGRRSTWPSLHKQRRKTLGSPARILAAGNGHARLPKPADGCRNHALRGRREVGWLRGAATSHHRTGMERRVASRTYPATQGRASISAAHCAGCLSEHLCEPSRRNARWLLRPTRRRAAGRSLYKPQAPSGVARYPLVDPRNTQAYSAHAFTAPAPPAITTPHVPPSGPCRLVMEQTVALSEFSDDT
jgi:hypothetical protein